MKTIAEEWKEIQGKSGASEESFYFGAAVVMRNIVVPGGGLSMEEKTRIMLAYIDELNEYYGEDNPKAK